jgi:protein-L-isoaspartate(D-aspartate) O-methyltransferase
MVFAKLIQAAEIGESDRVLDVGCATGYSAALLGRLAGSVTALEVDASLAQQAAENLRAVGAAASVVSGPLGEGWARSAPYDVILLDGAVEVVPQPLLRQLKDGGRLVGVLGRAPNGKAMLYRAFGEEVSGRAIFDAAAAILPGFARPAAFVF